MISTSIEAFGIEASAYLIEAARDGGAALFEQYEPADAPIRETCVEDTCENLYALPH